MKIVKGVLLFFVIIAALLATSFYSRHRPKSTAANNTFAASSPIKNNAEKNNKLLEKGSALISYCKKNGLNSEVCFLIDMSMESGSKRFFIYGLKTKTAKEAGLVAHGRCNERWLKGRKYSNSIGSGCTSLGKYKVGKSYQGTFGLAFKLYGLDATNNNAYNRFVVLHAHSCVPANEVAPQPICQSDGCPTVAPAFLQILEKEMKRSSKPILLYIFE